MLDFEKLLETEDPKLTQWLCYSERPDDQGLVNIVKKILSSDHA